MKHFIAKLKKLNLFLVEKEGDLILKGLKGKLSAEDVATIKKNKDIINFIKTNKPALIDYLKEQRATDSVTQLNLKDVSAIYELSPLQQGMLFHGLYDSKSSAYTEHFNFNFPEGLDIPAFKASWEYVLKNHSILRSSFIYDQLSIPVQCVFNKVVLPFEVIDYSNFEGEALTQKLDTFVKADLEKGFDFKEAPLMRITLIKTDDQAYKMIWAHHHILWDGWSVPIMMDEMLSAYEALLGGKEPEAIEEDHYEDYIKYINAKDKFKEEQFWKTYMQGFETPSLLPFIGNTPERNKGGKNTEEINLILDKNYTEKLKQYAQKNHLTTNTVIQGVWSFLLSKYTGNQDTTFGAIVSGRPTDLAGAEQKVGLYINTLPLRSTMKEGQSVTEWLTELQEGHTKAREYQYTSISKVQKWSGIQGEFFDSILVFENYPIGDVLESDWALNAEVWQEKEQTNYLVSIAVAVTDQTHVKFLYNADLLASDYAETIKGHFETVLDEIIVLEKKDLNEVEMLTKSERLQLLSDFNDTALDYPREKTIIDVFQERVTAHPDRVAVVFGDKSLTYQELDERSNQMAHCLLAKGVKYQDRVGILSYRGLEMIISTFGVLKCGATYVPLNIDYPLKRLEYLLGDSSVSHVIYSHDGLLIKSNLSDHDFVGSDDLKDYPTHLPGVRLSTQSIAYVMYTSGTTGEPKGILVNQQNILKLAYDTVEIAVRPDDRVMQWSNFSFDGSTYEIYSTLLNGACLHMINEQAAQDPSRLAAVIRDQEISVVFMTTALFNGFVDFDLDALKGLRKLLFGGELVSVPHVKKALKVLGSDMMVHVYGPTETTVYATYYPIRDCKEDRVPIGRPLSNTSAYILHPNGQLAGIGVAGELCIGGDGVSMGYLNRNALTEEKFIKNPFLGETDKNEHTVLYKTGDLVCWLPDGNIDFIGRRDAQVKIRGYRIELGEIETAMQESPLVNKCVVLAKADANGNKKRLVAYVVPTDTFDKVEIQNYLKSQIPEYMVPSIMVEMDDLPLNLNGKVDKKALPEPDISTTTANEFVAPQTEVEISIAEVWKKLLNLKQVGIHDNFFELGGDSIICIQVVSRIKRAGYQLQPRDLFKHQTIAELAQLIKGNSNTIVAEQGMLTGTAALLPIQQWFLDKNYSSLSHFNQENLFAIDKNIAAEHLDQMVKALVRQHDALRFEYTQADGLWIQTYGKHEPSLDIVDLTEITTKNLGEEITKVCQENQESLNIETGVLIKAVLVKTPDTEAHNRLFIVIHHFAVDGVSWRIILDQLFLGIEALGKGEALDLGMKSSSFRQWVTTLEDYSVTDRIQAQLSYWQNIVNNYQALPLDFTEETPSLGSDADGCAVTLDEDLTQALLQEVNQSYHTEINDILLSALAMTISSWSGQENVIVGLEGHGREHVSSEIDTTSTVGWFTNLYPIALSVAPEITEGNLIKSVKEQLRAIPQKGMGYGLLRYLHPSDDVRKSLANGKWDIVFNYLGQLDNVVDTSTWLMEAEESAGFSVADDYPFDNKLDIGAAISGGKLSITWVYSKKDFEVGTINELSAAYLENLTRLIRHCQQKEQTELTACDYGLAPEVSYQELDQFLDTEENGVARRTLVDSIYRLSPLQEGMLFHHLYDKNLTAYTEQLVLDFPNGVQIDAFRASWEYVIGKHSILRTAFFNNEFSIPVQCAYKATNLPFEVLDFSQVPATELEAKWDAFLEADIERGFDFTQAPLMRVNLVKTGKKAYKMLWTFHHILIDGWSIPILVEDLLLAYEEFSKGATDLATVEKTLNRKEDRYEDYIKYIGARDEFVEKAFWKKYMGGFEEPSLLPFVDNAIDRNKGGQMREMYLNYDHALTEKIKNYAQAKRITVNTLVQGVWGFLLSKYTSSNDTVYGVTVSGRPADMTQAEERVGLFINAMPVRVKLDPAKSIEEVLSVLQQEHTAAREFQYTALNDIQKWNNIQGDLFDSLLAFENYPLGDVVDKEWNLEVENLEIKEQTNYLFSMAITLSDVLNIKFGYNLSLLQREFAEMIKAHFELVIDEIVVQEKKNFSDIELLTATEKELLLETFNDTSIDYPEGKTSVDLFEEQVKLRPDNIAVAFNEERLTYRELNERANQLASHLRTQGIREEAIVGICISRSVEMIVSIMGVLKAGAAYLPIDAGYPQERIDYIINDSKTTLVVTDTTHVDLFAHFDNVALTLIDKDWEEISKESIENVQTNLKATNLAYIIYTSGSTGRPKGVMIEHASKVNIVCDHIRLFGVTETDRLTQFVSLSFDASIPEIFMSLCSGACLVVLSKEVIDDQDLYIEYIKAQGVTVASLPSGYLSLFDVDQLSHLRAIMTGGDIANVKTAVQCAKSSDFINAYGPTECTVCAAAYKVKVTDENRTALPIGKPSSNTQIYILDQNLQLLPPYAEGEICIGGLGVARGYLNRPELTAEKFIPNPFNPAERIYRTGDKGKWLPGGDIAFLGRIDDQVKIRGHRIELGEIEAVLDALAMVKKGLVLAKKDSVGNKRLVAYVLPEGAYDKVAIETGLKATLPDYMVPAIFMELSEIPLTSNDKIDKKALPNPAIEELMAQAYVAPSNEIETILTEIWQRILNLERVGVMDDFFELGGHSLLATRVISAIRKELKTELAIKDLFLNPTVASLASFILNSGLQTSLPEVVLMERPERIPLSFSQNRLWFVDKMGGSVNYHMPVILRFEGDLDLEAMEYAFNAIVNRHEILRTVYQEIDGIGYQVVLPENQWTLDRLVAADLAAEVNAKTIANLVDKEIVKPFDLAKDHMLRTSLLDLGQQEYILAIVMHHIASDGWSMAIFVKELVELYEAKKEQREFSLPALPIQYIDYTLWQHKYLNGDALESKLQYWENKLSGLEPINLPLDFPRPATQSTNGATINFNIDQKTTQALQELAKAEGVTMYMLLMAIMKVLLYRYAGQEDICIGSSVANRTQAEIENLIGLFVNTLAFRSDLSGNPSFKDHLAAVKQTVLGGLANQEVPFEKVVDRVIKRRDRSRSPLFQVLLVLQNNEKVDSQELSDVTLSGEEFEYATSKFDLSFFFGEDEDGMKVDVIYCNDLFLPATIEGMIVHFNTLLTAVLSNPTENIGALEILAATEKKQLLEEFSEMSVDYPTEETLVDWFERQVAMTPDEIAVAFESKTLSYADLNDQANRLAKHLIDNYAIQPDDLVGIMMESSELSIVSMLGIMKAGAAYVPIDVAYPMDRKAYIIEDTKVKAIIIHSDSLFDVIELSLPIFSIDIQLDDLEAAVQEDLRPVKLTPDHLAYVIYTSGSTGQPKGVLVTHRNLTDYLSGLFAQIDLSNCKNFGLMSTMSADLGNTVLYGGLMSGGAVHVFSKASLTNADFIQNYFKENAIDCIKIVPSHWKALETEAGILLPKQAIVFGGEKLSVDLVNKIKVAAPNLKVVNHYGPTETTIGKLLHHVDFEHTYTSIPIGKPFSNTCIYVVGQDNALCPVGVPGELLIGGVGVARGYLNLPEQTQERFIQNPFQKEGEAQLLYRTGDLVCMLADGSIDFRGRVDSQVKIRGFRVELGEIEKMLEQSSEVEQAVVITQSDVSGTQRLVAYLVPTGDFHKENIQTFLSNRLPEYMVPSIMVELEKLPLTANGKIDKKALPNPDVSSLVKTEYVEASSEMEIHLVTIWKEILGVDRIGIMDDFFELGGHSLLAIRVVSAIRQEMSIEIDIADLFDYLTVSTLAAYLETKSVITLLPPVTVATRPSNIPLSFSQERLWFLDQLEGSTHYHIPSVQKFGSDLDQTALAYAFEAMINRHEVLRTVFVEEDGQAYQRVLDEGLWSLEYVEKLGYSEEAIELEVEAIIAKAFDLSKDHPLRAVLLKVSASEYLVVLVLHHIASDGWSNSIFFGELMELYEAKQANRTPALAALKIQYADYAIWQRTHLSGDVLEQKLQYWENKLKGVEVLNLPTDYVRPAIQSTKGAHLFFEMDPKLSRQIKTLAKAEGVTMFMLLLSAFKVLLYKYTGQDDISVGSPIANRTQAEIEALIGFFVNTLTLRTDLSENPSFDEVLRQVKATTLEAYNHQDVPFEKIVDRVVDQRDMSRTPLFQVMFILGNNLDLSTVERASATAEVEEMDEAAAMTEQFDYEISKFDLSFNVFERENGLSVGIEYCSDLFAPATIERMMKHYEMLLSSITLKPTEKIDQLGILSAPEKQQILFDFNDTERAYPTDQTLVDLFEGQVAAIPTAIAVVFEEEEITYQDLNEKANQVAHYLRKAGLQKEDLVCICIDRSVEMMVGILGILKAGGAYVPIDPSYPAERMNYILEDTATNFAITNSVARGFLETAKVENVVLLDEDWRKIANEAKTNLDLELTPENLAYIIYTSGSTGKPKGVMNQHSGIVNRLLWTQDQYNLISGEDVILQKTTFCFDVSVWELFWPFIAGVKLVFARPDGHKDNRYLKEIIEAQQVTTMHFVPSMLEVFLPDVAADECQSLRRVLCSGEALKPSHVAAFKKYLGHAELHNLYGPTEAAIDVSYWEVPTTETKLDKVPIGKPVANTKLYILDKQGQLCPVGVPGELHIAGIQVARGYHNRPSLTAERFIEDSLTENATTKLYKTGDFTRWLANGDIEFFRRLDDQVKIRGFRIELGEIEAKLQELDLVYSSIVVAKEDASGDKRLVAYIIPNGDYNQKAIRSALKKQLPDYMVPAIMMELDAFPLTSNGKIDKKALPNPVISGLRSNEYVAPRNETEAQLAEIWTSLIHVEKIGIHDNFFELGGHSLLATRLVSEIRKTIQKEVPIREIFLKPTIASLADYIVLEARSSLLPAITVQERPAHIPLSFSQERLWFVDKIEGKSTHYHIPMITKFKGELDFDKLSAAFKDIVNRHETLRTVFEEIEGQAYQKIMEEDQFNLTFVDFSENYDEADETDLEVYADQYVNQPFDLAKDHLMRAQVVKLSAEENALIVVTHHIATDGWSGPIFLNELSEIYTAKMENRLPDLPVLKIQYADYALWQRSYLSGEVLEEKLTYWNDKLSGTEVLNLPTDFELASANASKGAKLKFFMDKTLSESLTQLAQEEGVTLFMLLLSIYKTLLHKYSGQKDISVGIPIANRTHQEVEPLIGFFLNTLALRDHVNQNVSFQELLHQVKQTTLEAYTHQDIPFEKVLERVKPVRQANRAPLFQVFFTMLNQWSEPNAMGDDLVVDGAEEENLGEDSITEMETGSKFDITLYALTEGNRIGCLFAYNASLFREERMKDMAAHFQQLARSIVANRQTAIGELNYLSAEERAAQENELMEFFND
ncbi:MAG: non-ribosomal peptide synthase/polyketide synthase [Saprospiraceae bacterium]